RVHQQQARRRVAPYQGGRGRPPRSSRAAGISGSGCEMITNKPDNSRETLRDRQAPHVSRGPRATWRAARAVAVYLAAGPVAAQQPQFKSSVEVPSLDVTVVDDRGKPIADLKPDDFVVRIDGATRKVVSAEWVPLATPSTGKDAPPPPEGYSTNE